ncbi:mitochondrial carrier domain-containing protein [Halteromyces radiatus]|uniref:mitochondrial carrier domain-containing protein n=1 Tax=Halteromyces radiatus TaxID=101107 RepID=UPI00221E71AC|nr:mitochondrial carrier domain-containing protein [Halteromyces radiatus]KAI8093273.1 mitochondrial carrier domain-containing protein [Halteromyces radiatus]
MAAITKQTLPPVGHAIAGSAGAMFALALVYPLDIIKTRIQVQAKHDKVDDSEHYKSAWDGICQIVAKEGLSGLYAGLGSSLLGTASTNFTYFYCYSFIREQYNQKFNNARGGTLSTGMELLLGAAAGALTTLITTPVSVVTTRQQTLPAEERQDVIQTCQTIIAEEGVAGLWRGIRPSLVLCVNPAITYGSFEKIKQLVLHLLQTSIMTPGAAFGVGALSKTLATIITYPYIMAKVRMQWKPSKEMQGKVDAYKSAYDVLARVIKQEGFFGWYKGMSTQITKAVLSQALLFMMKDIFTNYTILAYALLKNAKK